MGIPKSSRRRKEMEAALQVLQERKIASAQPITQPVKFRLEDICFPEQLAFIQDPADFVTACCSRRSGKTEACVLDLLNTAYHVPGIVCLYITMTRANAERIMWSKLLEYNRVYELDGEPNVQKLSLRFPNGSVIYLSGCKDKSELDKFRGMALKLVYLDEIQGFRRFIKELIDDALAPTLADYAGKMKFIGTPNPLKTGYFWDLINSDAYAHHAWTFWQNPHIALKSGKTHEELMGRELKRRGIAITEPSIRREWFGEWADDTDALVFKYNAALNNFDGDIECTDYIISVDIGYHDSDAFAVIGWHKHKPDCFLVEESSKAKQGITELSDEIERLMKKYNPMKIVMDTGGLGKKIAEELRKRRAIPIEAADKTRKIEHIELLNDALRTNRFRARYSGLFAKDSFTVEWDYDKSTSEKRVIKAEPHSDICDAVLYGFREALHWLSTPAPVKKPRMSRAEWLKYQEQRMLENIEEQARREASKSDGDELELGEFPQLPEEEFPWRDK